MPHLRRLSHSLRRDERGVTMYLVIGVMLVTSLLMTAVLTATSTDASLARRDLDAKKATYAAQAGIAAYLQQLNANPNYWTTCPTSASYSSGGTVAVPDSTSGDESYSYAPIPAPGYSACSTSNPTGSMVTSAGTFRVQFNGYSGVNSGSTQPVARSIVVTFKHESFLNYVYFTEFEQQNPSLGNNGSGAPDCVGLNVQQIVTAQSHNQDTDCLLINWVTGDNIDGPMFSDDYLYVCGQPRWGSTPTDLIYTQGVVDNTQNGCAPDTPQVNSPGGTVSGEGTLETSYKPLDIPQSNDTLEALAEQNGTVYNGVTKIALGTSASTYTVTNANVDGGTPTPENMPANGVIYVAQSSTSPCTYTYIPTSETYTEYQSGGTGYGCGTVFVSGTYDTSLTIASSQDVVITGNLTSGTSNALLGLVPQNWARVYHEVLQGGSVTSCDADSNASNASSSLSNPTIDAAILTTTDSWIVDNYDCGAALGNLTIDGALAQYYRGTVGTTNGHGYLKVYKYDTRLEDESPPYFLSPVDPAWSVQSESSCSAVGHLSSDSGSTALCY